MQMEEARHAFTLLAQRAGHVLVKFSPAEIVSNGNQWTETSCRRCGQAFSVGVSPSGNGHFAPPERCPGGARGR